MQLGDIFDDMTLDLATAALEIERVESDSRRCTPGTLFVALPGTSTDGAQFAADAVNNGAVAVVSASPLALPGPVVRVPVTQLRSALAHAAAAVTGHPDQHLTLVGVTGTNAKTTVTTLVAELASRLGWRGETIGTLNGERTTPAPPDLWRRLGEIAEEADGDSTVVAMEVSSHALDQERVAGLTFAVAAFTNLSHDHLDYHQTMERYYEAKALLFRAACATRAVIWVDDPYGARLARETTVPVVEVRRSDASGVTLTMLGTSFFWRGHLVMSPLLGDYNVDNALMALSIMASLGADEASLAAAFATVSPVPGRMEVAHRSHPTVIVDYAHTPDGLERLLRSVRDLGSGRVVTVFGCGGDRDRAKRPLMGQVAAALSDVVVVTSDNPRHEEPAAIIADIVTGMAGGTVETIVDRRAAIARALELAGDSDVVVVAGKGHEATQIVGDEVVAFDDRTVVRELMG
jgi:UDP-N-acetylmuramoyl-L-alanyl-D-glutamate--2,6-diaminopimelate ligase